MSNPEPEDEPKFESTRIYETPAQAKVKKEIAALNPNLVTKRQMRDSGLSDVTSTELANIHSQIKKKEKELKRKESLAKNSKEYRARFKNTLKKISEKDEEIEKMLKPYTRKEAGQPRLETNQPELLATIVDIVQMNSATDARQKCDMLRTCTTLDDLCKELNERGFQISRSATYLRLLPKRGNTQEGLRHVQTVPVKLLRPENSLRKENKDRMYAKSIQDDMQALESLFGHDAILYLSNDDKARIGIGVTAANKQANMVMNVEYKVRLLDHDFVIAPRHKLIPSVYAVCNINPNDGSMTYSGPTFVRVRSGKHDSSTAFSHLYDMKELFESEAIPKKPILLISTDGAQDEAPRFPKSLKNAVFLFKMLGLDVYIHATNAAGLSAFNPCERRMAPLTHDLVGLVLPAFAHGSHLDDSGKTIDNDLEIKNFFAASEVLSDVWSRTEINGFKVDCKPVPMDCHHEPEEVDQSWASRHVLQTRYMLMVVKCTNTNCCKPFITNWNTIFPQRFLPMPAVYEFGSKGLLPVEPSEYAKKPNDYKFASLRDRRIAGLLPSEANDFDCPPFDLYCPSMMEKLPKCVCETCGLYWPSEAAKKRHATCHKSRDDEPDFPMEEFSDEFCQFQDEGQNNSGSSQLPVVEDLQDFLRCPFRWPDGTGSDLQYDEMLL